MNAPASFHLECSCSVLQILQQFNRSLSAVVFARGREQSAAMPISAWEMWACAQAMIRQHGSDAGLQAAMKADALLFDGEHEGAATWRGILRRINQLEAVPAGRPH